MVVVVMMMMMMIMMMMGELSFYVLVTINPGLNNIN